MYGKCLPINLITESIYDGYHFVGVIVVSWRLCFTLLEKFNTLKPAKRLYHCKVGYSNRKCI